MRWLARILSVWMPASARAKAAAEVSATFAGLLAEKLEKEPGKGLDAYRNAARDTGAAMGRRLRDEFRLGSSFDDVELAWRLVSKASGMSFLVERVPGRSVFRHRRCPVYDAGGRRLCENFCLPLVEGLTSAIAPSCRVEMVEMPDGGGRGCVKALIREANADGR